MAGRGRAGTRVAAAHRAAIARIRQAAERLRAGDDVGDQQGARTSAALLLDQLADRDERDGLDIHLHDRVAALADRILATPPEHMLQNGPRVSPSYGDNGQRRAGLDS